MDLQIDAKMCCRTCMENNSPEIIDIFTYLDNSISLADILVSWTSVQIEKDDNLPKYICTRCYNYVKGFLEFRKHVQLVDGKLRMLFTKMYTLHKDSIIQTDKEDTIVVTPENKLCEEDKAIVRTDPKNITCNTKEICVVCKKSFSNYRKLEKHMKSHSNNDIDLKYQCSICQRYMSSNSKLEKHKLTHDPERNPYQCNVCSVRFKKKSSLKSHLIGHEETAAEQSQAKNGDQTFVCENCGAAYQSSYALSGHMRKHKKSERVLACSVCNKVFKKLSHLKRHEISHDDNRPYKCNLCPKSFMNEVLLNDHINKHKGIKPYSCPICAKRFSQMSTLNSHIKIHKKERPFLCTVCGKSFYSSTNLKQHMKRHSGDKPFACSLCPGRFVSKGELKAHTITHTGIKPFVCDSCGSRFTKPSSLAKHKLSHTGIKPYECDVCKTKVTSKDHLKRHYRIHTGEKPYRCELCDRAFTQSNDLMKHRRAHYGEKLYKCAQCSECFRLRSELRNHASVHFVAPHVAPVSTSNTTQELKNTNQLPKVVILECATIKNGKAFLTGTSDMANNLANKKIIGKISANFIQPSGNEI